MCKQTESLLPLLILFLWQVMVAFVFFRILSSVISLEQKLNKNGEGFQFVVWCMINTVSKKHIKIRKIERGIAKKKLCQHISWPSSYFLTRDHVLEPVKLTDLKQRREQYDHCESHSKKVQKSEVKLDAGNLIGVPDIIWEYFRFSGGKCGGNRV